MRLKIRLKGGAGSGFFGHKGRPGEVGGSLSENGMNSAVDAQLSLPTELNKYIKDQLKHSNASIEFKSPRYIIINGKDSSGNTNTVKIRIGVTDGKLRVFFGEGSTGELYSSVESAIEDALKYSDVKYSEWKFGETSDILSAGENIEE
ncbi:MAG: hypothetical protein WC479_06350 [Candidatus Izemoplasmatales bacterium]